MYLTDNELKILLSSLSLAFGKSVSRPNPNAAQDVYNKIEHELEVRENRPVGNVDFGINFGSLTDQEWREKFTS